MYYKAKECFDENLRLFGNPQQEPVMWNLNSGLTELTSAVQSDLEQIQQLLRQLLQAQQR